MKAPPIISPQLTMVPVKRRDVPALTHLPNTNTHVHRNSHTPIHSLSPRKTDCNYYYLSIIDVPWTTLKYNVYITMQGIWFRRVHCKKQSVPSSSIEIGGRQRRFKDAFELCLWPSWNDFYSFFQGSAKCDSVDVYQSE